jgi:hypothetical protein
LWALSQEHRGCETLPGAVGAASAEVGVQASTGAGIGHIGAASIQQEREINAKTQRREGAKRMKPDPSGSQKSNRRRPARETFYPCVFAPLRLCVKTWRRRTADVHGFWKKDVCGFLPKAATPGWK